MSLVLWPNGTTDQPHVASPFGPRKAPTAGASTFHRGVDLTGYARVRAVAAGRVVAVGTPGGWAAGGTQVWIQHDRFLSRSMHMVKGSPTVKVGDHVDAGDDLGQMGMTGTATGIHHHLEIVVNNVQIDPVTFISNRIAAPTGGGSTSGEWDEMATKEEIQQAVADALANTRYGIGGRSLFDLGNDARGFAERAAVAAEASTPSKVWTHPVPAQDANGLPLVKDGKQVTFQAQGYLASAVAQLQANPGDDVDEAALAKALAPALAPLLASHLGALSDEDVQRLAVAAADENARRLAG